MFRVMICALALAASASAVRAGELDREPAPPVKVTAAGAPAGGSELDGESPKSAFGWRYYYGGWGGFYPARVSYFNVGFGPAFYTYSPFGFYGGYYGGFGFSYRSYFPAYYSPFGYYGYWW